jgi:hypothetical protein
VEKKRAARSGSEKFNREASNRVDRSHSNPDDWMNSLTAVKLKKLLTPPDKSRGLSRNAAALVPKREKNRSAFEERLGRTLMGPLMNQRFLDPDDLALENSDPPLEFVYGEARKILADHEFDLSFRRFLVE